MMKKIIGAVLVAACGAVSTGAMATPITLTGSTAGNTLLTTGTVTGTFDGSSVLPADYTINSLAFSFTFKDDNDTLSQKTVLNGTTTGDYVATSFFTSVRDVTTYKTTTWTGEQESVALSLAGVGVGSGATAATTTPGGTSSVDNGTFKDGCSFIVFCAYSDYITLTTTTTNDWTGAFTISGFVTDASILNQLLNSDVLSYSMKVAGDLYLTSAQLNLDITETPKAPSGAVPEPSTIALALLGLGGLGASRRRKNRA